MAAPSERYYYGDFGLWLDGIDHVEGPQRGLLQEFQGVDRERALVIPASPNQALDLQVKCLGNPNPASRTRRGFRAVLRALRVGLEDRAARSDPVVWVEDTGADDVVSSYAAPTVNAPGHTYVNGDIVLIRRAGIGLYTLGAASAVVAGVSFQIAPVIPGDTGHAIAGGDSTHLVEAYWGGMVLAQPPAVFPAPDQDFYAREIVYAFRSSGTYTYARTTAATVGS